MDLGDDYQNCEGRIPFIPPSDDSRSMCQQEVRPRPHRRLLHFIPLTAADEPLHKKTFFGQATLIPRNCESLVSGYGKLPPPHRDLGPLSLGAMRENELSQERDLCALSLATYHASLPSLKVEADHGIYVTQRSENELGTKDRDLCALSLATRPASCSLLEVKAMPHRTVISPQPVRAIINNNARSVASERLAQPRAQPPVQLGFQPPVTQPLAQPVQSLKQYPAHSQAQPPAQLGTSPLMGQPLRQSIQTQARPTTQTPIQPLAHHRAKPRAQPLGQCLQPPLAQRGAQPLYHFSEKRRAEPLEQHLEPPGQPRSQHRAQPFSHSLEPTRLQPPIQFQTRPGYWPLALAQARPVQPPVQPRLLPLSQPQGQGQLQPQAAQPRIQLPAAQSQVGKGTRSYSTGFKGVTRHKRRNETWTERWDAHLWCQDKKQTVYLGSSPTEIQAARAYDRAAIHFRGVNAEINFPLTDYQSELPKLDPTAITSTQLVKMLRKQSAGMGTPYPEYPQRALLVQYPTG